MEDQYDKCDRCDNPGTHGVNWVEHGKVQHETLCASCLYPKRTRKKGSKTATKKTKAKVKPKVKVKSAPTMVTIPVTLGGES